MIDTGALRELATGINFDAYGVDVTVDPFGAEPVEARGLWLSDRTAEALAAQADLQRRDRSRVIAFDRDVAVFPRGTVITGPDAPGGTPRAYRVDGPSELFASHVRYTVVRDTDAETVLGL